MTTLNRMEVHLLCIAALLVIGCASVATAQTKGGFEKPPVLQAKDVAPAAYLKGPGFAVDARVPTDGLTTHFTIRSDVGTFDALGVETLRIRETEIPAIAELAKASKTETFTNASPQRPSVPSSRSRTSSPIRRTPRGGSPAASIASSAV
jgi:hypothetical protein